MKAFNIIWDVDDERDLQFLPTEIDIPDGMEDDDEISDYISEVTGFCHKGYSLDTDKAGRNPRFFILLVKILLFGLVGIIGGDNNDESVSR